MLRKLVLFLLLFVVATGGIAFLPRLRAADAAALPVVLSISPQAGPVAGGTQITIVGTGFTSVKYIDFDGQHITPSSTTSTQITVFSPGHGAGLVHIRVETTAGRSGETAADNYTYMNVPTVTSVSPSTGGTAGGTSVTIHGVGLTGTTAVLFGESSVGPTWVDATTVIAQAPSHAAGAVHVRVTNPGGTSATSSGDLFTYVSNGPVVTGVSPRFGPTSGGSVITIAGSGFLGAAYVSFGSAHVVPASVTDTSIVVVAPAHAAGVVHLRVTAGGTTSPSTSADDFTYTAGYPLVSAVSPRSGPTSGGTVVTISGTGFSGATSVLFSDVAVAPSSVSETQIVVVAPAHGAGLVHLLVTTPVGTSVETPLDDYTYGTGFPQILEISPNTGPSSGGTLVTISGTGLSTAVSVAFGDVLVAPVSSSSSRVLVYSPAHTAGVVHIRVTTLLGTSPEGSADQFTYTAVAPVVSRISPINGSVSGGTLVTITGHGFSGAQSVSFGDASAVPSSVSDTEVRVVSPPARAPGLVHLRVTTPSGVSGDSENDNFLYVSSPRVTVVSPNSGSTSGGELVVIHGVGFTGTTVVNFGSVHVAPVVVTDTEIQVVTPAHEAGLVHLRITSTGGTSPDSATDDFTFVPAGPAACPATPLWVNDAAYGSAGAGFYWDPPSGMVWTAERLWHLFAPRPARPAPQPLWVNALTYGSPGGGFYWDPVSGQVWTAQRGWHSYSPQGCVAQ